MGNRWINMPKFNPDWEIDYLFDRKDYRYCVIKRPEPIMGDKVLMVKEGCIVHDDGRWFYWQLRQPIPYESFKHGHPQMSVISALWNDGLKTDPDKVVSSRLNRGHPGVIPAPVFKRRGDDDEENNWIGNNNFDPRNPVVVPDYVPEEMLGDLTIAHLQLCDELQEGKPLPKIAA